MPVISRRKPVPSQFNDAIHPLLQRIFSSRGATCDKDIDYSLSNLHSPQLLKGLPQAVELLLNALQEQKSVLIVGDFDADGATSCALSVAVLRAFGLQKVDFLVPNRFEYGYGLTPEIVEVAQATQPDLIVTVDNGIASVEGVRKARSLGIKVIVTDHHLPPKRLPEADAIVNPNQQGCGFPSKNLAGVGVIFYVLSALRSALREQHWFEQQAIEEPKMADYLDLVALGTVADVVPLDHNNRILVNQGLQRLRVGCARPGIMALLQVAGKDYRQAVSSDFGFIVGPRLNAAGRLDDMSVGIRCLLTEDVNIAYEIAVELDGLNRERRAIEASMQKEALAGLESMQWDEEALPVGITLFDEAWHQGVVGILASRIKDKFHRPVIAFAPSSADDDEIKGSARSISGLHIRDALDVVATKHPGILQKFGGHAMAAGLSIKREHYTEFAERFDQIVRKQLSADDLCETLLTDGELDQQDFNLPLAHMIQQAAPWGQQFPEPLFDGEFFLLQQRIVGEKHLKMLLAADQKGEHTIDAIAFNINTQQWPDATVNKVLLVYQLAVNVFRGQESVQLIVRNIECLRF
ncbi:single-stranded-DNA-specific exonuclease RecJ [Candidatus Endobugula sertula]|uniref:Single-stranded-DNA-specific exonuclease RecJ n=1 Tax=Candidatus Endobugula sertula TaxID=62101 RepID=A0A1D2QU47_9GAMM|nr:single-stranded-DNA-specific exonuclease RecJ [Candidatus Endobugula sertula]